MHIIVCAKQIPSPDMPSHLFQVDEAAKQVIPAPNLPLEMSPFDAQALEAALRIRDAGAEVTISLLSLGPESARDSIMKHGFSLGADEGVLLCDPAFDGADSYTTALALTAAIKKLAPYDLILTGRQAADWDAGVVGSGIAELLGCLAITFAKNVQIHDAQVRVERVLQDGFETLEAPLPAVVTVSNELGEPRTANLRQVMRAARKKPTVWTAADLDLDVSQLGTAGARLVVEQLFIPVENVKCTFVQGDSAEEKAANLVRHLEAAKAL